MKIEIKGNAYFITTKIENTGSNYNLNVRLSKNQRKNIICGWYEKHTISDYDLLTISISSIKEYETQEDLF